MNKDISDDLIHQLLKERLSDQEQGELFSFCQNKNLVHAVEKALLAALNEMGTVKKEDKKNHYVNWAFSTAHNAKVTDEELGKAVRIMGYAVGALQDAFNHISKFGVEKTKQEEEQNPAI